MFVLFGHLLQFRKNPCYFRHFEYLTKGSRTQHCQCYAVQRIIQNKQRKTKQTTWECAGKFTKTKGRREKQGITPQRVRASVKEKALFQDSPSKGTAGCAETAGGTRAKGNKIIGIGISKVLRLQSILEATFSQPLSASYFLPTILGA